MNPEAARLSPGVWLVVAGAACFTAMGVAVKIAVPASSTADVVFWRSVQVALVAWVICRVRGVALKPGRPGLLLARSVFGLSAMLLYFWAMSQIPLATATALIYAYPIFTVLLSRRAAGEDPVRGATRLAALGFVGVLMILRPDAGVVSMGAMAAFAAALLTAGAYLSVRNLRLYDPPERIVLWFALFSAVVTLPLCTSAGLSPEPSLWLPLLCVGVGATGGQLFITAAYRVEKAWIVGPLSYVVVLFSWLAGVVWFGEHLTGWSLAGAVLLLVSGVGIGLAGRHSQTAPATRAS